MTEPCRCASCLWPRFAVGDLVVFHHWGPDPPTRLGVVREVVLNEVGWVRCYVVDAYPYSFGTPERWSAVCQTGNLTLA